ncbi:SH3 domain-containing protein [Sulfurovum sp. XTW-4]|uniref:SH3 domain-containing protein n=1 Tax=Sulfurovum xiamenensis TaxID=3019066 RepID=A0ABT7QU06_9BACT|nr:SH3 domain-containing protein [Sulfurovum xiamenensis]MDM5264506.1 SH3 domain-containing protein [Sulfurovum xiamenensis]
MDNSFKKLAEKMSSITTPTIQLGDTIKAISLDFKALNDAMNLSKSYGNTFTEITQYNKSINKQLQDTIKAISLDYTVLNDAMNLSKSYGNTFAEVTQFSKSINEQLQDTIKTMSLDFKALNDAMNLSMSYKDIFDTFTDLTYKNVFEEIRTITEFEIVQEIKIEENESQILFFTGDDKKERLDKFVIDQIIQIIPKIDVEKYKNLSPTTQKLITAVIMMFLPALYFYSSVYFEAYKNLEIEKAENNIQAFLEKNATKIDTDKVRKIKKIPQIENLNLINKDSHRFITVDGLRVRSEPSIKAQIIDHLNQGKIVEIVDKDKSWTKVIYEVDDSTIQGWIFTRYTKKFD